MIVVMPNGSLPRSATGRPPAPGGAREATQDRFTNELLKDIIPYVEKHYRVQADRENRASGLVHGGRPDAPRRDHPSG